MPTIFDKYEIHFDGNNVYCDYPVIIGVNGTNTTKLIFDADAGIEHFVLKTSAGGELSYAPVNDIVTLTLSASYAGEDYDCLVMLEAGDYHLRVSVVETPYFHDEHTEEQADDNTEEIVKLNAAVKALDGRVTDVEHKLHSPEVTQITGNLPKMPDNKTLLSKRFRPYRLLAIFTDAIAGGYQIDILYRNSPTIYQTTRVAFTLVSGESRFCLGIDPITGVVNVISQEGVSDFDIGHTVNITDIPSTTDMVLEFTAPGDAENVTATVTYSSVAYV